MGTLSERLRAALAGPPAKTQAAFAPAYGIKALSVNDWVTGKTKNIEGENLLKAAAFLDVTLTWLTTGKGPMQPGQDANVVEGPETQGLVPLISWVRAGDFCEAIDNLAPGDAEQWLPCPFRHGEATFCLRVIGLSMAPEYREGEIIAVDPSVQAEHGDDVVARTPDGKVTFKRLQITPEGNYLQALNPDWPERLISVPAETHICGVVIGSWMERR